MHTINRSRVPEKWIHLPGIMTKQETSTGFEIV
jgi:hypothetical protein